MEEINAANKRDQMAAAEADARLEKSKARLDVVARLRGEATLQKALAEVEEAGRALQEATARADISKALWHEMHKVLARGSDALRNILRAE